MKLFLGIWVGVIILGWGLLFILSLFSGGMAPLLLISLIIAALIRIAVANMEEVDELRRRLKTLEETIGLHEEKTAPSAEGTSCTTDKE